MRTVRGYLASVLVLVLVPLAVGCGKADNSAGTDKASKDLREAQGQVDQSSKAIAQNRDDIEEQKRTLAREQQALADKQKLVAQQQQELGSAQGEVTAARAAYGAAVTARFAKLEAALATLATRTDAGSRDAVVGLRARRDQLAVSLSSITNTPDPRWTTYTQDVDTTFDAIERDLRAAN